MILHGYLLQFWPLMIISFQGYDGPSVGWEHQGPVSRRVATNGSWPCSGEPGHWYSMLCIVFSIPASSVRCSRAASQWRASRTGSCSSPSQTCGSFSTSSLPGTGPHTLQTLEKLMPAGKFFLSNLTVVRIFLNWAVSIFVFSPYSYYRDVPKLYERCACMSKHFQYTFQITNMYKRAMTPKTIFPQFK